MSGVSILHHLRTKGRGSDKASSFFLSFLRTNKVSDVNQLGWADFFKYRTYEKKFGRVMAVPSTISFCVGEALLLSQPFYDPTMTLLGYDITMLIVLSTFGGTVGSWILGSMLGRRVWRWRNSNIMSWMHQRQSDFYQRIIKHRVNAPSVPSQPTQNLDFHGEKINSISSYRTWLRRQMKYKKQRDIKI